MSVNVDQTKGLPNVGVDRKELMNELYDALLYTTAGVGVSMIAKKAFNEPLTSASSLKDVLQLTAAVGSGVLITKWLQQKRFIPTDPFKL